MRDSHRRRYRPLPVASALLLIALAGCAQNRTQVDADNAAMQKFIELMMPQRIELQERLTRPEDFDGDGNAEGLEVILTGLDSFGDPVKIVGTFVIELHEVRYASGDRTGDRLALWRFEIVSDEALVMYWDRLSRFYRFPLKLQEGALPQGRYIVSVTLNTPDERRLFDEYEFEFGGVAER